MTTGAPKETFYVVLCWGRVLAGPEPGVGPAYLFVDEAHAGSYAAQLRAQGLPTEVRSFAPNGAPILEWKGKSVLCLPPLPPPVLSAVSNPPAPASSDEAHPANGTPLAPPPTVE